MGNATSSSDSSEDEIETAEYDPSVDDVMEACMAEITTGIPTGKQRMVRHRAQQKAAKWFVVWIDIRTSTPRYYEIVSLDSDTIDALRVEGAVASEMLETLPSGSTRTLSPVEDYTNVVTGTLQMPGGVVRVEATTTVFTPEALD